MNADYKCLKIVHPFVTFFCYWWRNCDVS